MLFLSSFITLVLPPIFPLKLLLKLQTQSSPSASHSILVIPHTVSPFTPQLLSIYPTHPVSSFHPFILTFLHVILSSSFSSSFPSSTEPVSNVVITADPPTEAVETNNTVLLTCTAKGSFLNYTWFNGTVPVVADGKRLVLNTDRNILNIKDVQRWDLQKPIYCRASNDLEEEMSAGFNMTVSCEFKH